MTRPRPTPIFRLLHIDSLATVLARGVLHAPNFAPNDGLPFHSIHRADVQHTRRPRTVPCCRGGPVGDYVSCYLGPRSPMLYQLQTGRVPGYTEGQGPLVYLVSTIEAVLAAGLPFAFTDRHSLATYAKWSDREADLDGLDWSTIYADNWARTADDPDRQLRKQAELLVHRQLPLSLCNEIVVVDPAFQARVSALLAQAPTRLDMPVAIRPKWYY